MGDALRVVQVVERHLETPHIVVLCLADPLGQPLPLFAAGAHIDVEVKPGLTRQYSLCGLPNAAGTYHIGVLKDPSSRGGSIAIHSLSVGDQLRISEPRNHFPLVAGSHQTVLFAGGIGVTPLLCMAEQLSAERADFALHYCTRSPEHTAFKDKLARSDYAHRVFMHFDNGPDTQRLQIEPLFAGMAQSTHIYICGPGGFISWICEAAAKASVPDFQVHHEYFKADPARVDLPGESFRIKIASTGHMLEVPANQTILSILHHHGIVVPVSCSVGVCGTCLTGVIEGIPDHRDFYLNDEEKSRGDRILPCCSRSRTPLLVLDL